MKTQSELNGFIREHRAETAAPGPLTGLRVLDLGTVLAAPTAAALLGDYGAEVIKIENRQAPDATRGWGIVEEVGVAPFWSVVGRNKYPITLNLKQEAGRKAFLELIDRSDVLIENLRPGAMNRLGLGPETLLQRNPGLVIGSVSGYGQTGPQSSRPGFGTLAEGFSGFTYLNAQPDGPPTNAPLALADFIAGLNLALAIMIALRGQQRNVSGGEHIDVSLYEPLFGLFGADFLGYALSGQVPQPKGNELTYVMPRNNYQTRDEKWVTLSCSAQKPFERLMEMIGHPEMNIDPAYATNEARTRPENRGAVNRVIAEWIGDQDLTQVLTRCQEQGITIGPIASMAEIESDPHYQARESFIEVLDPAAGVTLKLPNVPFRLMKEPGRVRFPGLPLGSANEVILKDLLGYSDERIRELEAGGVI